MSYVNTGIERCKTLTIDKKLAGGDSLPGYPKDYNILLAFTGPGGSYAAITETNFKRLTEANYILRLNAFKSYVQSVEGITSVDAVTETGYEAYRENLLSCPLGVMEGEV